MCFFFGKGLRGMVVEVHIVNLLGFLLYFFCFDLFDLACFLFMISSLFEFIFAWPAMVFLQFVRCFSGKSLGCTDRWKRQKITFFFGYIRFFG